MRNAIKRVVVIMVCLALFGGTASASLDVSLTGDASMLLTNPIYTVDYKDIINTYLDDYSINVNDMFGSMADAFSTANVTQPNFGEPHRSMAAGVTLGGAFTMPPESGTGSEVLLKMSGGVSAAPFFTMSLDSLGGFFKDVDVTAKVLVLELPILDYYSVNFFNVGGIIRKKFLGQEKVKAGAFVFNGLSLAFGAFYANNNLQGTYEIGSTETFDTDSGTVTLDADSADLDLTVQNLSFDLAFKSYVNLLWVLDIFAGAGITLNVFNNMSASTTINGAVQVENTSMGSTSPKMDGGLRIAGSGSGSYIVPRVTGGIQLNFGPVKLPIQGTMVFSEKTSYCGTVGLTVSW